VASLTMVGNVWGASTIYLCLAEKAGPAKSGGIEGKCPKATTKVMYARLALPKEEATQQTLLAILPHVKYVESGVGGKPTIQFSGVNVQVVNGEGKTVSVNGEGNLIIGYDESTGKSQSGSHNLILGEEQDYTSYGGILGGFDNTVSAPTASVTGGEDNTASAMSASISGGFGNVASNDLASVSGGLRNSATGPAAWVDGGLMNSAEGRVSSIFGGDELSAPNEVEAIP
jgi:hypothetical protein